MPSNRTRPPVDCCRGTRPNQAAIWCPLPKVRPSLLLTRSSFQFSHLPMVSGVSTRSWPAPSVSSPRDRGQAQRTWHPLCQPQGAPRHLVRGWRARVPRLRLHRALRAPAHLRENPRRHRRGQEARSNTRATAARPGDGLCRAETHRGWIVTRTGRQTARNRQGNGLQNRECDALTLKPGQFGP